VVADHRNRTAERADETDLDCFLLGRSRARCEQQGGARRQKSFTHCVPPRGRFGPCSGWPNVPKFAGIGPPATKWENSAPAGQVALPAPSEPVDRNTSRLAV